MTDNSFDKDNPLKQVLQLCSTLAGKGCDFSISVRIRDCFSFSLKSGKPQPHKAKKRSPSFYRRQERRRLLRKKNICRSLSGTASGNFPSQRERHRFTWSQPSSRHWLVWFEGELRTRIRFIWFWKWDKQGCQSWRSRGSVWRPRWHEHRWRLESGDCKRAAQKWSLFVTSSHDKAQICC